MSERQLLPVATAGRVRAELSVLLRPRRLWGYSALVALVGAAAVSLLTAPLLGRIVDLVAQRQPASSVHGPVLALAGVALGQGLLTVLGIALVNRVGEGMLASLRERFVAQVLDLPLERIERAGSGDLTSRVSADVAVVSEAVRQAVPQFARSGLLIALTLVGLAALDWRFMLAGLVAVPVQVLTARWYLRRSAPMYRAQREAAGAQQQQLLDTVGGAATVRAFRLGEEHTALVAHRSEAVVETAVRVIRTQTSFFGRLNLAEFVGTASVLVVGFFLVRSGTATVGAASAAALYFINLFGPVNQALFSLDTVQSSGAALARLVGVLDTAPRTESLGGAQPVDGSVKLSEVSHAYLDGPEVLHDIDLDVTSGNRIALVGATGAGKSTLAKLVSGIHQPSSGTVQIGGVEPVSADARRGVALVTQEVHVFAGRLADDLRLARPGATDDELLAALRTVGAADWALALPDGLDTIVGSGGHSLTVVQSQQLALARLVLADPPVAVLDEATAEAGSAGAKVLDGAALNALEGRTGLMVAHRLTQAATADQVVVMDGGRIVEQGTHDELLAEGGRYAGLWAAWQHSR
ncbi:ABC transporter ATP-binding protein [Pseudonocardia spinosispora]|uniref:ABC transporter ATP-binding protein n=1 Tax=Pseudonocardia spinosispora TaxID=103441 RepID=UPI000403FFF4|nr:ABC transporter ATP-binding protein [Pseudonocardia spinosispora]